MVRRETLLEGGGEDVAGGDAGLDGVGAMGQDVLHVVAYACALELEDCLLGGP